jgi:uncharacterized membrane protein YccC
MKNLLLYAAKVLVGGAMVYGLSALSGFKDVAWCLVSVGLVLSPDSAEALPLALTRIKANVLGGLSGFLCLILGPARPLTIGLAMLVAIASCHFSKAMSSSRSALAAVIIVMLHGPQGHSWSVALERIVSVIVGCLLALVVTYAFHWKLGARAPQTDTAGE